MVFQVLTLRFDYFNIFINKRVLTPFPSSPRRGRRGGGRKVIFKFLVKHHPVLRTPLLKEEGIF
jgi:hypothetical protein